MEHEKSYNSRMKKCVLNLPAMSWFEYGKIYSGSLGTDPLHGCLSTSTFHYRVQLVSKETVKSLVAVCYFRLPWNMKSNMQAYSVGIFEPTEFGIEVAENWILQQFLVSPEQGILLEEKKRIEDNDLKKGEHVVASEAFLGEQNIV